MKKIWNFLRVGEGQKDLNFLFFEVAFRYCTSGLILSLPFLAIFAPRVAINLGYVSAFLFMIAAEIIGRKRTICQMKTRLRIFARVVFVPVILLAVLLLMVPLGKTESGGSTELIGLLFCAPILSINFLLYAIRIDQKD